MDFTTTYTSDYTPKYARKRKALVNRQRSVVADTWELPIVPVHVYEALKDKDDLRHPDEAVAKMLEENPCRGVCMGMFKEPLDHKLLQDIMQRRGISTYQDDYCKFEDLKHWVPGSNRLPAGWTMQQTTYRSAYRDYHAVEGVPRRYTEKVTYEERSPMIPNEKVQALLASQRADTEYHDMYGETGRVLLERARAMRKEPDLPNLWDLKARLAQLTNKKKEEPDYVREAVWKEQPEW